jgi:hypothetical protein
MTVEKTALRTFKNINRRPYTINTMIYVISNGNFFQKIKNLKKPTTHEYAST